MSSIKSKFHEQAKNISCHNEYRLFDEISLLAKGRFKWLNLPDGVESKHIEQFLFDSGQVAFFKDEELGFLCLPCYSNGQLNVYGEPLVFNVNQFNYQNTINIDNMVRIISNDHATPNKRKVFYYTDYIAELDETMRINLEQQRYPFIIPTTKKNELSMRNLFKKIKDNCLSIFVDERFSESVNEGVKVLNTGVPYLLKDLHEHKNDVVNEMLTWLGLNNTNNDKRERMLVDEINSNNSYILMNLEVEYKHRKLAVEKINEMFGLNIEVVKVIDELQVTFKGDEQGLDEGDDIIG